MSNVAGNGGHGHTEKDEMHSDEHYTGDDPFDQEGAETETSWVRQAYEEGADAKEGHIDGCEAGVIPMPLILYLLGALRVHVELLG